MLVFFFQFPKEIYYYYPINTLSISFI
jgi:hypothetical protein